MMITLRASFSGTFLEGCRKPVLGVCMMMGSHESHFHVSFIVRSKVTGQSELRSCVKEEVDVLGSPSLTVRAVSACGRKASLNEQDSVYKPQFPPPPIHEPKLFKSPPPSPNSVHKRQLFNNKDSRSGKSNPRRQLTGLITPFSWSHWLSDTLSDVSKHGA